MNHFAAVNGMAISKGRSLILFEKQYLNLTPGKYENSRQIASIKDNY